MEDFEVYLSEADLRQAIESILGSSDIIDYLKENYDIRQLNETEIAKKMMYLHQEIEELESEIKYFNR